MNRFVSALDSFAGITSPGEKGFPEYRWSPNIQEQILQFFFQLVRCDSDRVHELGCILDSLLSQLIHPQKYRDEERQRIEYISLLYRMIGHTRDIIHGKGEYTLSYMMVWTWYHSFPDLALYALSTFVLLEPESDTDTNTNTHPYGSWKDIKYFANYCKEQGAEIDHPLIQYCIQLANRQLRLDLGIYTISRQLDTLVTSNVDKKSISLCAKWIPRENSAYSWLFKELAKDFFQNKGFFTTAVQPKSYYKALKKCYTYYRKVLSELNRSIDTVQIKQCGQQWASIDHHNTTSITLARNKRAFLNKDKMGNPRSTLEDRIQCAEAFQQYIQSRISSGKNVKGKRVGLHEMTRQALELFNNDLDTEVNDLDTEVQLLNAQWRDNASQTGSLGKMIAMVDTSGSMEGNPLHCAVALGIRVAENSILGKRVLTFSEMPTWHSLDNGDATFVSMVHQLTNASWGVNTNFYSALKLILDALVEKNVPAEDASGMILAVFSDMQMDNASNENIVSVYDLISTMYRNAGYEPPHILFWNLRSTNGFPSLSTQENVSMMSGFSPALLNAFCEKGLDAFKMATPWNTMVDLLLNERYDPLAKRLETTM
jgi:hypothetical protein